MHEWDTFAVIIGGSAGAVVGLLVVLDHRAGQSDSRKPLARALKAVNPSTLTARARHWRVC